MPDHDGEQNISSLREIRNIGTISHIDAAGLAAVSMVLPKPASTC